MPPVAKTNDKSASASNSSGAGSLKDFLSKMSTKAGPKKDAAPAVPTADATASTSNGTNKKPAAKTAIEDIYQKKTQLEHILLRPDTYIGSVEPVQEVMWIAEDGKMVQRSINYVPGLYKIFDEILVNAADNKQRDPKMDMIKIDIDQENNQISIWNNGTGIPVVEHKDEKMYVPTMIFGHLLTSSNFNDEEKKVVGGRNGYGAKLCNVFSTKFVVETANKKYKRGFKQTWENNMAKASSPKLSDYNGEDYTKVTFKPDLAKFNMKSLDNDIVALFSRRAYDVAGTSKGVKVMLNGKRLPIKNFKDYVDLFLKDQIDEGDNPVKFTYEVTNERWEIAACPSDNNFQQNSFVNSIATTKGGRHVDHVADLVVKQLVEAINKKNKNGIPIKPFQIKNHLWLFVNCLIENPTFDSQTKENMTLQVKSFGSKCTPSEKFYGGVMKSGVVEKVLQWAKFKAESMLGKTAGGRKANKLKGLPKLEDANDAGTKNSLDCTLILTEGDSAKTLAVAGLGVIGRDKYGVFPLRGKLLNVREASTKQIMDNAEINAVVKILGLKYKQKYQSTEDMKSLRYGRLMIMTDQDHDGSHIKGLIINFIHHNWPSLLKMNFLEEFITPIVKVTKGNDNISFFSLPELEEWKKGKPNWKSYRIKYYKGLGTSTSKEAKEYFSDMKRHRILFKYNGSTDDDQITMAFSKKCAEQRKDWLTNWMEGCKRRKELGLAEDIIYNSNVKAITYSDFINKELVLFSNLDNERSIPSLVDGFKPGQRKVIFTCFKRNDKREVKVAQLAGSVAEHSSYHHGEQSLMSTIVNLAQNYVGSNNINLLLPNGQFGTRLQGGKDSASPRYIFTMLSPLARTIFNAHDDAILKSLYDDSQRIEPEWYCPIIPMVLVNGADGIGTGWMTKIPNFNPREIVENLRRMIRGDEPKHMRPWYKNFKGEIIEITPMKYAVNGEISILSTESIEITELPIGTWTQTYKESVVEPMVTGTEKVQPVLTDYKEYHTDTTVKFILSMKQDTLSKFEERGMHQAFKIQSVIGLTSMVLFDKNGCLKRYDSAMQILQEFFDLRMAMYQKRKEYLMGILTAEALKLSNQARFIVEKCDGTLTVENKKRKLMIEEMVKRKYDSDPIKAWKAHQVSLEQQQEDEVVENEDTGVEEAEEGRDFDYLLGMPMWSLTLERKEDLLKKRDAKEQEVIVLKKKTPSDIYNDDLDRFMQELDKVEKEELEDITHSKKAVEAKKGFNKKALAHFAPSPKGQKVAPKLDDIIKRVEAATKTKQNKGKRTAMKKERLEGEIKDEFDLMADDDENLFEKLNSSAEGKALKDKKKPGTKKAGASKKNGSSDGLKQTKLNFGAGASKKGKRQRDSDSSDESSDLEFSPKQKKRRASSESSSDFEPRTPTKRDASALFDSLVESKQSEDGDGSPSPAKLTAPVRKPVETYDLDSDSGSDFDPGDKLLFTSPKPKSSAPAKSHKPTTSKPKPKASPKKAAKKHAFDSDSDEESSHGKKVVKKSAPKKTAKKRTLGSDTDEEDFTSKKVTKKPPAKKASKKNGWNSDSDSSFGGNKKKGKRDSSDEDFEPSTPVKTEGAGRNPRRAAATTTKTKYVFDDDEEEKSSDSF